jgi:ribosomal-protein-alanine N-acetyltransferase
MKWYQNLVDSHSGLWFAIMHETGEPMGGIGLNDYSKAHRNAEVGYWLLPEYWGKGVIKSVLPAILEFGFSTWNLHRIEALVEPENIASSKLLLNTGFTFEGTRRECELKGDTYISLEIYALLDNEFTLPG